ncbi:MAG: SDR family NAD(P)-dependent oxidoreductase [Proteobacteria bacterium]|nr:SDR family NAD(P)-dependent oxidoreductase [Pseudomonadota bacterium]
MARHLASRCRARLALLSRTPLPPRADWEAWLASHGSNDATARKLKQLLELESLGAEILVLAGDVANVVSMREALAAVKERFGQLNGVFHAAGALDDGPIQAKTQASIEGVFAPKVHGTLLLHDLLQGEELDFFALFSSTSSKLGAAGQVDYVAASTFLNAFAQHCDTQTGPRVVAIDWGVWRDVGLAVETHRRLAGDQGLGRPAAHPLLDTQLLDAGEEIVFSTELESRSRWILDEHRTGAGHALIPGTGYLALAHGALAEIEDTGDVEIRNALFVAPLAVPDGETVEMRVLLSPDATGHDFEVESRLAGEREWQLHAQGSVAKTTAAAPTALDVDAIRARCPEVQEAEAGATVRTSQEAHLRFGPRWECARVLRFGRGEALAEIEAGEQARADLASHPLHPALLDIATGFASPLIPGYTGRQLYAPIGYDRVHIHGPLPERFVSHARGRADNDESRDVATFDVTLADEDGRVLVEVEGFAVKRLTDEQAFAADRQTGARETDGGAGDGHRLSAAERVFQESYDLGIRPDEGMDALERILADTRWPQLFVSSIELRGLVERYRSSRPSGEAEASAFERPELDSEYLEPRDEVERSLAAYWAELLGLDKVGIRDDFFELGGHSLIAVRLFSKIKKKWNLEYGLSVLFDAPTIERCAELIRDDLGVELGQEEAAAAKPRERFRYLVPLQRGDDSRPPFILVAGMFGNVLNLRHVATHLGSDQTVYAVQAKGLLGDDEPHRRFPDMARDYLEELRKIQPEGPYYLGGFSGGGITAFEMAQQLRAAGETVGCVILLDSLTAKQPPITRGDLLRLHWRRLQRKGAGYLVEWVRRRIEWERQRRQPAPVAAPVDLSPAEFRSSEIEKAFREALVHYAEEAYDGHLVLFRPSLDEAYEVRPGMYLNDKRVWVAEDNLWGLHVPNPVEVYEVTGDHDSMVLEPHVRVLAAKMREVIDRSVEQQGDLPT